MDSTGTLTSMNTTRVTRAEAAVVAHVSERTISRWARAELITTEYARRSGRPIATYAPAEVRSVARSRSGRGYRGGREAIRETSENR